MNRRELLLWTIPLSIVLLLLLIPSTWIARYTHSATFHYPWQLDREEGFLLNQAILIRDGLSIYPDIQTGTQLVGNYPPVYPIVYTAATYLAGETLAAGRLVVTLGVLAAAACTALILWLRTRSALLAAIAPMLFLTTWDWNNWSAYARVDIPAIALSTGGLVLALWPGARRPHLIAAGVLFALGLLTKQTQFAAPLATIAALAWARRRNDALLLAATAIGGAALVYIALFIGTGGRAWNHLVVYNANVMHWDQVPIWLRHYARLEWEKGAAAVIALWLLLRPDIIAIADAPADPLARRTIALWFLLTAGGFLQLAKAGSACNYLLEYHVASAAAICLALGDLRGATVPAGRLAFRLTLLAALIASSVALHTPRRAVARHTIPADDQGEQWIATQASLTNGPILSELPIYTIMAGQPVTYQPFIMTQLAREGRWDQTPFLADLESRRHRLIIMLADPASPDAAPGWTQEMKSAILRNYQVLATIPTRLGPHHVLIPR